MFGKQAKAAVPCQQMKYSLTFGAQLLTDNLKLNAVDESRQQDLLEAARDIYYIRAVVAVEHDLKEGKNLLREMVTVPRNRRPMLASGLVMFMHQFCGVNVISYYSSTVFVESGLGITKALLASPGTGILNWLFAIPAFFTIDTFGRRKLLLVTLPIMSLCLLITRFSFFASNSPNAKTTGNYNPVRVGLVLLGIYLFEVFYSPGIWDRCRLHILGRRFLCTFGSWECLTQLLSLGVSTLCCRILFPSAQGVHSSRGVWVLYSVVFIWMGGGLFNFAGD